MKKAFVIGLCLISLICTMGVASHAFAQMQGGLPGGGPGTTLSLPNPLGSSCSDLTCPLNKVIDFIFTISIPICGLMVLWGGFQMVTSAGNPEKVTQGRKTILYAAAGFVVILLAKGVAGTIKAFLGA